MLLTRSLTERWFAFGARQLKMLMEMFLKAESTVRKAQKVQNENEIKRLQERITELEETAVVEARVVDISDEDMQALQILSEIESKLDNLCSGSSTASGRSSETDDFSDEDDENDENDDEDDDEP